MSPALHLERALALLVMLQPAQSRSAWFETALSLYWNGEYEQTIALLTSVSPETLTAGEKVEYHQYLAFSHIALGDNAKAEAEFIRLLSVDPGHRLDPSVISPKIIEQFDLARMKLVDTLFSQGKAAYFNKDYQTTIALMDRIARLDPDHQIAGEYKQLALEHMALTEKAASLVSGQAEAKASPSETDVEPPDGIYRISSDITPPVLVARVAPVYPMADKRLGEQGTVVILIVIERDGTVKQATVLRSINERLDRAALEAVKRWKYRPGTRKGKPVRVSSVVGITFEAGKR